MSINGLIYSIYLLFSHSIYLRCQILENDRRKTRNIDIIVLWIYFDKNSFHLCALFMNCINNAKKKKLTVSFSFQIFRVGKIVVVIIPEQKRPKKLQHLISIFAQKNSREEKALNDSSMFVPVKYWREKLIKRGEGIDENESPGIHRQKSV